MRYFVAILIAAAGGGAAWAQSAHLRQVDSVAMPSAVDSNSPAFWQNGQLRLFNSTVKGPILGSGPSQFAFDSTQKVQMNPIYPWAYWMESVWQDPNG